MAIQLNASDIHLRSSKAMGLSATSAFSVSVWINTDWSNAGTRSFAGIYGPSDDTPLSAPVTAMQIGSKSVTGQLDFWTWGGGTLMSSAPGFMNAFNNIPVFIVYTFDGTTHRAYRNGVQVLSALNSSNPQIPGFLNQIYVNGFPGSVLGEVGSFSLDQYGLYRRALSDSEIITMYNSFGGRHGIDFGIIAKFEFDEKSQGTSATSIVDFSGNEHTLAVVGAGSPITHTYVNSYPTSNLRMVQ